MAGNTSLTFKLFGQDVSASKALKNVGKVAGVSAGVLGGLAAMDLGRKAIGFATDTVNAFGDLGGQTLKLQRYMGGTAEDASRLGHAFTMTGIDSDTAGKSLGILSKHLTANDAAAKSLGTAYRDAHGKLLPMGQILPSIAQQFSTMPNGPEKTALAMRLFGRAGVSMLPFLSKGAKGIKELQEQSDALGTTLSGDDLDAVKENTKAKRTWGEAVKGLQVSIGRELYPALTVVTKFLSGTVVPVIRTVVTWIKEHKDVVGLVVGVIGTAVAAFKVWTIAMAVFNAVAAANPVGLIVIAIAALVAGIIYAWNNFEGFRNVVTAVWESIKSAIDTVVGWFQDYVWPVIQVVIGFIVGYYRFLWNVVKTVFQGIWTAISVVVQWFAATVWPKIRTVIGFIVGYYRFLFTALKTVWSAIFSAIAAVVNWFRDTAWPKIKVAIDLIKTGFGAMWGSVKEVWDNVWSKVDGVRGKLAGAAEAIKGYFSGIWDGIASAAKTAFELIRSMWNSTLGGKGFRIPDNSFVFGQWAGMGFEIPYLAEGGIATRPTLAMIGEAGPEAVVPLTKGHGYISGGGGDTYVFNVSGVVGDRHSLARTIVDAIDSAVEGGTVRPRRIMVRTA